MERTQDNQVSLKSSCKNRLKDIFYNLQQTNKGVQSFLLVLDSKTVKLVSSFLKMMELMELGISAIEKLELKRKSFKSMHAIYLVEPSQSSIDLIINDFNSKKKPQYGFVHLLFTNRVDPALMEKIAVQPELMARIKSFTEINQDFQCNEENVFNLELPNALPVCYSMKGTADYKDYIQKISSKLTTLVPAFQKFYEFEIVFNQSENKISLDIATQLESKLNGLIQNQSKSKNDQIDPNSGKITFLIIDRAIDPLTPVIHDFYYQPLIYDLLNINGDFVEYSDDHGNKKKAVLTDNDDLFSRYRYMHIAQVLQELPAEFSDFVNNNTTAKAQQGQLKEMDLNQMSQLIRSMPQYNELLSKYTMHMKLIENTWNKFEEVDLKDIGEIEQSLATGIDKDGKEISSIKLISQISARLNSMKLSQSDKLRLAITAILTLQLVEKDRVALTSILPLEDQQVIRNLIWLGISFQQDQIQKKGGFFGLFNSSKKSTKKLDKTQIKTAKHNLSSQTLDLCRYTPIIETIVQTVLEASKSYKDIVSQPAVKNYNLASIKINEQDRKSQNKAQGSLRNKGGILSNVKKGRNDDDDMEQGSSVDKLIIFIVGGLSFGEIRAVRNMAAQVNQDGNPVIIMGSTSLIKPIDYINNIRDCRPTSDI